MGGVKLPPSDCGWNAIEGFGSDIEYERFRARILEQVQSGLAKEERVKTPYSGIDWDEHWYQCAASKQTWRLVAPDPPFNGIFEPVDAKT
jgi:hypothetical protein